MKCGADLSEIGPPKPSWFFFQPWLHRRRRPIRSTVPFCCAWLVGGPRQLNVLMPVLFSSVGSRLGRLSRLYKSGVVLWVFLSMCLCKARPRRSGRPATTMVRHSLKLFRLRWLTAVPISTSAVRNSTSCALSESGMFGTTAIANVVATMIVLRATTCASGPMARKANSVGSARHQLLPRNGFCRHGAVRRLAGVAGSVSNGKITKATMDMSGWATKAIRRCPSYVPRYRPQCAHTGRLVCP